MANTNQSKNQIDIKFKIISFLCTLPALLIGTYTMFYFDVPSNIWVSNLCFIFILGIVFLILPNFIAFNSSTNGIIITILSIIMIIISFLNESVMGIHRWINLAGIRINVGFIISPLLLFQLSKFQNFIVAVSITSFAIILFLLQPDASQVTAFSIAALFLLVKKTKTPLTIIPILLFAMLAIGFTWYNLDKLPPINYVENIVYMAAQINNIFIPFSIISLIILTLPFFILYIKTNNQIALSLGIYFSLLILATFLGNFPVIIMGYGLSPIIGYFLGLMLVINNKEHIN